MSELNTPRVAVLLAAYNGMRYLPEQLGLILAQKEVAVTVFISVDRSSDGTEIWVKEQELTDKRIVCLPYGSKFGGAAKNFFYLLCEVDFAEYDFVSFADQDDLWLLDKLSHGIKQINNYNVDAYSANVIAFWPDGREKLINKSQSQRELDYLFEAAGPGCTYILTKQSASLIKKTLNQFPELNDFVLHDWLSYAILRHNKLKWFIDPTPKMKYRQHESNQVGANTSLKGAIFRFNYILSGEAFNSVRLLTKVFNISNISFSSRKEVFLLALKARKLRRRRIDQVYAFIVLLIFSIKGP